MYNRSTLCFYSESGLCDPNPCLNGGLCIEAGTEFRCVCNGTATGYGGQTCGAVIVHFPPIPPVTDGVFFPILLYTNVNEFPDGFDGRKRVGIKFPNKPAESHKIVDVNKGDRKPTIVRGEKGVLRLSLPSNTDRVIYLPRKRDVFVTGGSNNERKSHFELFNLTRGLLQPSCCSADDHVTLSCPGGSTQSISLLSPCQWITTVRGIVRTDAGVVFAKSSTLSLPTSLSSFRYRDVSEKPYINDIKVEIGECVPCDECSTTNSQCSCYDHTPDDTVEFLQARALAFTYINQTQTLLPSWLKLFVDLRLSLESITSNKIDLFAPITRPSEPVSSFEGCDKLTNLDGSRYSVLRYDKTLSAVIDGQRYDYREDNETGTTGDVMCFAVDLCHESESPVHMQISQPINDILVYQYLRQFTDRQWNVLLNTVSVFKQSVTQSSSNTFWNGMEMMSLPDVKVDISMNTELELQFNEGGLNVRVEFSGDASFEYRVSYLYLHGH